MANFNRRDFLKLSGLTLGAVLFMPWPPDTERTKPIGLGRVTEWRIFAYSDPRPGAQYEYAFSRDDVIAIYDTVSTEGLLAHNPVWNLTKYGWVYSSWVQPVENKPNDVELNIPATGFWGQVSIPYTEMRAEPNDQAYRWYRLYYSSVHQVVDRVTDENGAVWYQLKDDQYTFRREFVHAEALRRIQPRELSPLSPQVMDKRIEVSLEEQVLRAYENNALVFSTRCATGSTFSIEGLGYVNFTTPLGEHSVVRKRPARHMVGFLGRRDQYDLPGVPFCTYFTLEGAAVHGAYWHNDFGHPRSHGCVNVQADAAKWVYRWTMPFAEYEDELLQVAKDGTPIVVT